MENLREAAMYQQVQTPTFGARLGRDLLDEVPESKAGLAGLEVGCVKRICELLNLAAVGLCEVGMQHYGRRNISVLQPAVDLGSFRQRRGEPRLHLGIVTDPVCHHVGYSLDPTCHLRP
jgi:hypothetical protein